MSYVCFILGSTAATTVATVIEVYIMEDSPPEQGMIHALNCRRLDLVLKSIAAAVGVASVAVSLVGIPCVVSADLSIDGFRNFPIYL